MYSDDFLIKKVAPVEQTKIDAVIRVLKTHFADKWTARSMQLMKDSLVLKALTPTQFDRLPAEDESFLKKTIEPFFAEFIKPNEKLIYLDVSCLPANTRSEIHFDYAWIHVLSRRLRIPLFTNDQAIYATLDHKNNMRTFNLKVGYVYETNNMTLHAASNYGAEDRWHLVADIIDCDAYKFLEKNELLDKNFASRWCNYHFDEALKQHFDKVLRNPATDSA